MTEDVDRELRAALRGEDETPALTAPRPRTEAPAPRGNLGLLAVLLVVAGGVVTLVMTSFKDAAVYAMTVDQLASRAGSLGGRRVRVEGNLVKGSLTRRDQPCEYRFHMAKNGSDLAVRFPQCVVPDTFRDVPGMDVGVTVEGKLAPDGALEATQVLAKCPSKYEMKDMAAKGQQMPHAEVTPEEAAPPR